MVVTQAMGVQDMEDTITKVVRNILTGQQQQDNDRDLAQSIFSNTTVEIMGTTETKCPEMYLNDIRCYDTTVTIDSKEDLVERILQLTVALKEVIRLHKIAVTQRRDGYPLIKLKKNTTPYPVGPPYYSEGITGNGKPWKGYSPRAEVWYYCCFCGNDEIPGIAPGETWSATSRGICSVTGIYVDLTLPDGDQLRCTPYTSFATSYSQFFIIMKGDNACCVQSSHESGVCP